ncbi:MAG: hypothetical protein WBV82_08965 [Myxococcaceae bacterium]
MRALPISFLLGICVLTTFACRRQEHRPAEPARGAEALSDAGPGAEACVDAWLNERKLDSYGHPEGTMYTGGTPLFDERTGEQKDRLEYVFGRHPEARAACTPGGTASADAGTPVR